MPARAIVLSAVLVLQAGTAFATGEIENLITDADRTRLDGYEATRKEALAEARDMGQPGDLATLEAMMSGEPQSFSTADLTGEWKCRTAKAGGLAGLVIYGWFNCRVTDDGSGWRLEKLSGSQRTTGRFFTDSDTRLIYLGSFYVSREDPPAYGSGPQSDQVGYAYLTAADHWRIEFPAPTYESKLDILELRR